MDEYQGSIFDPVNLHKFLYANANPVMYTDPTGYFSLSEAMGSTVVRSVVSNIARGASRAFVETLIDTAIDLMLGEELSAKNFWRNYLLNFALSFAGPRNPYKPGNLADNFNQQNLRHANKVPGPFGKGNKGSGNPISENMKTKVSDKEMYPLSKRGNAPISKRDNKPIEIHHEGQNPKGPFHEMHPSDHRYGENYKRNHPNWSESSQIDRNQWNKDRRNHWKSEWDSGRWSNQ